MDKPWYLKTGCHRLASMQDMHFDMRPSWPCSLPESIPMESWRTARSMSVSPCRWSLFQFGTNAENIKLVMSEIEPICNQSGVWPKLQLGITTLTMQEWQHLKANIAQGDLKRNLGLGLCSCSRYWPGSRQEEAPLEPKVKLKHRLRKEWVEMGRIGECIKHHAEHAKSRSSTATHTRFAVFKSHSKDRIQTGKSRRISPRKRGNARKAYVTNITIKTKIKMSSGCCSRCD